jgi:hypothetical protein
LFPSSSYVPFHPTKTVVVPVRRSCSEVGGRGGLIVESVDAGWSPRSIRGGQLGHSGVQLTAQRFGVANQGENPRLWRWLELVIQTPCAFLKASLR